MAQADRFAPAIIAGKATKATMQNNDTYAQAQGELGIATDESRFYIGDSSYRFSDLCNFVLAYLITARSSGGIMVLRSTGTPIYKR